jgi:aldehyde dehydrogenase (NAD+)
MIKLSVQTNKIETYHVHKKCRFIEPTILVDPPLDATIMIDEVFGPLLPIITVSFIACKYSLYPTIVML